MVSSKSTLALLCITLAVNPLCAARSLAQKPQMGWNSWNTFKTKFNQSIIESTAATLISTGLKKAGYEYVILDEGWQSKSRDSQERQQADPVKFPDGMAALVTKLHNQGLKVGVYSDAGIYDCGFYPGSYGYEELDAQTYAQWGMDYLKYDNCGGFQANTLAPQVRFATMRSALLASGRDIFFSLCQWGNQFPWFWADQISESYRMSGDIHASFASDSNNMCTTAYCLNTGYAGVSVLTMIKKMRELSGFQAPGSWADMDMLEIGTGAMTELEEQTHQSFWAALKSPLIIGADITNMSNSSLNILLNDEIIDINQDNAGKAVSYLPLLSKEGSYQIWAGELSSGNSKHVILALNEGSAPVNISISWSNIPELANSTQGWRVRDIWADKKMGLMKTGVNLGAVRSHETKVLVLSDG